MAEHTPVLPRSCAGVGFVNSALWAEGWGCRDAPGPPEPTQDPTLGVGVIILKSVPLNILSGRGGSQGKLNFGSSVAEVGLSCPPVCEQSRMEWEGGGGSLKRLLLAWHQLLPGGDAWK